MSLLAYSATVSTTASCSANVRRNKKHSRGDGSSKGLSCGPEPLKPRAVTSCRGGGNAGTGRVKYRVHLCLSVSVALCAETGTCYWIFTAELNNSPVLGAKPSLAASTLMRKAMHEEHSFNEVVFVNHSTSRTWSFLENEQFCIKWSISVNGGVLTSSHRAQCCSESLVKWNHWNWAGAQDRALLPLGIALC